VLIDRLFWLRLHVILIDERAAGGAPMSAHDQRAYLAFSNAISHGMRRLGLEGCSREAAEPRRLPRVVPGGGCAMTLVTASAAFRTHSYWGPPSSAKAGRRGGRRCAPPFNPTLPQSVIDAALERDPEVAAAEWLVEWRSDLADFVSREVVDAAVVAGRYKLPPLPGVRCSAFVDPSGGSSDSMMLAMRTMGRMAA
jgi:hypothetical protein